MDIRHGADNDDKVAVALDGALNHRIAVFGILAGDSLYDAADVLHKTPSNRLRCLLQLHDASAKLKIKDKEFSSSPYLTILDGDVYDIKINGLYRIGTKYTLSISGKNDYEEEVSYSITGTVLQPQTRLRWKYIIKGNKKFSFSVTNAHTGDVFSLKIGKKTYKKKLKKSINQKTYTLKINKAKAGTNISFTIKNKFNQSFIKATSIVYQSTGFKRGMTMKQIRNVAGFRYPVNKMSSPAGTYWYYDRDNNGYNESWILFANGKVKSWRIQH